MISSRWWLICGLSFIFSLGISGAATADLTGSLTEEAIVERLQPVGKLNIDGVAQSTKKNKPAANSPANIYKTNCKVCHDKGVLGAPKTKDKAEWDKRLAAQKGIDGVTQRAWDGYGNMPAKGGCLDCSKEDIKKTIEYMLEY